MSSIPKTRVRRTVGLDAFATFFGPPGHHWEVTLNGHLIAEFDNHPDALAYAHQRAANAQRDHVHRLERDAREARRAALNARPNTHPAIYVHPDSAAAAAEVAKAQERLTWQMHMGHR